MSKKLVKTPLIYALEPRLLFDGDLGADAASAIVYRDGDDVAEAPVVTPESQRETSRFEFQSNRRAIVFIDGFCLRGDEEARVSRTHVQIVDSFIFAIGRAKGSRTKIDQIIDDYSEVIVNYLAPYMPADDA